MHTPSPLPQPAQSKLAGRLWVLAAALMWSSGGVFAKATVFDDWPLEIRGPLLAFWRASFAALVLAPTIRRPRFRWYLVPLACCFAAMNVTYLTALVRTTAANAIWLQNTAPWWVFLFAVLSFREPIVRRDLIPLLFGLAGVGTILLFEIQGQAQVGVIYGVASGVFYAAVIVFMRQLRAESSPWLIALNHAVAAGVLLPWVIYLGYWPTLTQMAVLACFGALQMAVPYTFLVRGLRSVSSQEAVAIALVEPVLMPLWVFLAWGEKPAVWTLAGAALILAGLLLRYVVWELWSRR